MASKLLLILNVHQLCRKGTNKQKLKTENSFPFRSNVFIWDVLLLYSLKGEYFNDEEVRIMLAREAEEDRKRRDEELAREEAEELEAKKEEGKRKKRGIIIANWDVLVGLFCILNKLEK